jgi:hypothetical protein
MKIRFQWNPSLLRHAVQNGMGKRVFATVFMGVVLIASAGMQVALASVSMSTEELGGNTLSVEERNRIVLGTTAMGVGGVTAWGVVHWNYFTRSPNSGSEEWFGGDSEEGGMDKLGHLYGSYVLSHGIARLYEHWAFERNEAACYGTLTSFAVMTYMELGDSFSNFGFSYEDLVMNTVGCGLGYLLYTRPDWANKVDLRIQPGLKPTQGDILTDYENTQFLLALKLNGFDVLQKNPWRHVELHLGYDIEGFDSGREENRRYLYAGVGFNLTDFFRRQGRYKTATFFNYVQLPYTSLNHDYEL